MYVDPTITALMPGAAHDFIALMRDTRTWATYAANNTMTSFDHLEGADGPRAMAQWRLWRFVPKTPPTPCFLAEEPLYTSSTVTTQSSCVLTHVREVHFEMYRRYISKPKRQVEPHATNLFEKIMGPLEDYLHAKVGACFDWVNFTVNPDRQPDYVPVAPSPHETWFAEVAGVFKEQMLAIDLEEN
jgi:hypothetical protein